jgi:cytochrome c-type biogenesis protein CcmH/NrfG
MSLLKTQIEQTVRQRTIRQLLESARTRIEEDELPLALQKIGSVLEIDPLNADALALKSQVERQRSERQIENWFRLVRQHIDNQDYAQARQGIGEILKINSGDTQARELLASIDRTEQELLKAQEAKQKLYDAALDSYRRGEISTALNKLERLLELDRTAPKSANPERDAQYQSFYNQVRSEREAARNAYAEARKFLNEHNFTRVLETCKDYLAKHPGDPLFQALKIEAEEIQRQQQSQVVAEINRRVDAEADLDKKYNILNDAVEKYPQEPQFKASLKLVKERRDLINSIVERARQYEDRNQLNDAAGQWDILKNIYPQYPGLDFELQRLSRRREEQARSETKALWVEKIDRHLSVGEYQKASEVVKQALLEFTHDEELQGLSSLIEQNSKRGAEADALVREGQKLILNQKFEEGLEALRKAERLDTQNPAVRAALTAAILKRARELMLQNWRAAEPLVAEAVELDGADPVVRSLTTLINDYKRQEAISKFVVESRNLQAAGSLTEALKKVEEGLSIYPNEIRLSQLHNTLRSAFTESRRKESAPPRVGDLTPPTPVLPVASKEAVASAPTETVVQPPASQQKPPRVPVTPAAPPVQGHGQPNRSRMIWGTAAAAAVLVLAAVLFSYKQTATIQPKSTLTKVSLNANISNAGFHLDGKPVSGDAIDVKPGPHTAEASAPGYATESRSFTVGKDEHNPITIAFDLRPLLPELRIVSDLKTGKYVLDGGQAVDLQDGSLIKENISSGDHTLTILDGNREIFLFSFSVKPKEAVSLKAPLGAKLRPGVVVSSLGSSAKVYATPNLKGGTDDHSLTAIPDSGFDLTLNERQAAHFVVDDGTGKPRSVPIDFSPLPVLSVVLSGAPERIPIVIKANVKDGIVVIGGQAIKKPMADGARTLFLPPGVYKIKVTRDGYVDSPEQLVSLKSGDTAQKPLEFTLAEIAHPAVLSVDGAPVNAEVLIDDKPEGTIGANGAFTKELEVGQHSITIRKPHYEDLKESQVFKAGTTVKIHAVSMKTLGAVNLKVVPQHAQLSYQREGEPEVNEVANNHSLGLPAGTYEITAKASGFESRTETVTVASGQTVNIDWDLKAALTKVAPKSVTPGDIFENGNAWTASGWWVHQGKGMSFVKGKEGPFTFDILNPKDSKDLVKSKIKKIAFVVDYSGPENKIAYTLDSRTLSRKVYSGGKSGDEVRADLGGLDKIVRITVEISPTKVIVKNRFGKVLDSVDRAGNNGRFGFEDEVALSYVGH